MMGSTKVVSLTCASLLLHSFLLSNEALIENTDSLVASSPKVTEDSIENTDSLIASSPKVAPKKAPPQESPQEVDCGFSEQPMRVTVRHIEPNGVGYDQGYTTIEGFFTLPHALQSPWVPFLDLRGHIFNNGKFASNAGLGLRYLSSRVWGINAYYDYRNTTHQHYNQVSVGVESLGQYWDFRMNGYLPVGDKVSHYFHPRFHSLTENRLIISQKQDFAMKAINAEVGYHYEKIAHFPFYFAAGPYYLDGQGKNAWGGEARIRLTVFDYLKLEANTSYDRTFHWIGQGQVSVVIPFGPRKNLKAKNKKTCVQNLALRNRTLQPVDRNEIIIVDRKRKLNKAINPLTNEYYNFLFVNNTSPNSLGTFEDPYSLLVQASAVSQPGDVFYIFPGNGTTSGMDNGLTLKDNQLMLGSGFAYTIPVVGGHVTIPVQASGLPAITSSSSPVVLLANNNQVSGFSFTSSPGDVIGQSTAITNATITYNTFTNYGAKGIDLTDFAGLITIDNNTFTSNSSSNAHIAAFLVNNSSESATANFSGNFFSSPRNILVAPSAGLITTTITSNTFVASTTATNGEMVFLNSSGQLIALVEGNVFSGGAGNAIDAISALYSSHTANFYTIQNNTITGANRGVRVSPQQANSTANVLINKNTLISNTTGIAATSIDTNSLTNLNLSNNTYQGNTTSFSGSISASGTLCIGLENENTSYTLSQTAGTLNLSLLNSSGPATVTGTVNFVTPGTCNE